jgi:hypothetical protein
VQDLVKVLATIVDPSHVHLLSILLRSYREGYPMITTFLQLHSEATWLDPDVCDYDYRTMDNCAVVLRREYQSMETKSSE